MAREQLANAFSVLGQSFGQMAELRMQQEAQQLEILRQQSLERLRHKNRLAETEQAHELATQRMGIERGYEISDRASDRELALADRQSDRQFQLERDQAAASLTRERWSVEDRRKIEASAQERIAALQARVQEIRDSVGKGDYLDQTYATGEIQQAERQMREISAEMMFQLKKAGDPRYEDLSNYQLLQRAGYSDEEIQAQLPAQQAAAGPELAEPEPAAGPAPERAATNPPPAPPAPAAAEKEEELGPPPPPEVPDLRPKGRGRRSGSINRRDLFGDLGEALTQAGTGVSAERRGGPRAARQQDRTAAQQALRLHKAGKSVPPELAAVVAEMEALDLVSLGFSAFDIKAIADQAK